jgi:hypothetical protein
VALNLGNASTLATGKEVLQGNGNDSRKRQHFVYLQSFLKTS